MSMIQLLFAKGGIRKVPDQVKNDELLGCLKPDVKSVILLGKFAN